MLEKWLSRSALAFFVATVSLGLILRWDLTTGLASIRGWNFLHLRHAHSHVGYFGVLTLAWWWVLHRAQRPLPRWPLGYLATTVAAVVLFAFVGYRAATIVLSTVLAVYWLWAAWLCFRSARSPSWLDLSPWGIALGSLLIPAVAVTASRHLHLSRQLAHLFIGLVLLLVFVPAAWEALGWRRKTSAPLYLLACVASVVALIFDLPPALNGVLLGVGALLVTRAVLQGNPGRARWGWLAFPLALLASALMAPLRTEMMRVAGLHFLMLGPVLMSFASARWPGRFPRWAQGAYLTSLLAMVGAVMNLQLGWLAPPAQWAAWTATLFVGVSLATLARARG